MGKRGREDALTSRVAFLPLIILSALSSVTVAEFQAGPQIVNTFFDPKFHDDGSGGDSQAVESQFASPGVITASQEAYSFTTTAQNNPEDAYFSSSKPAEPDSTAPPPVHFETGSFQEFHQVSPINNVRHYGAGREISSSNNVAPEIKDEHISEPVASFRNRPQYDHHPHHGGLEVVTTYQHHKSPPNSVSSLGESGGSSAPEVIYAPDGWIPNTETFPDSDTTYAKPISSSSAVKWPEEVGSYGDNGGDITPQLYDYVEPALRVPTTTTPRPVSSQFHYATPVVPTTPHLHHSSNPLLGGYQFRVAHSSMLASIGNYVSSSVSSLFKSLPRLQLIPPGGHTLSQLVQQQQQQPSPPQSTQVVDYTSLDGSAGSGYGAVPPEPHNVVHQSYYHHNPAPPSGTSGNPEAVSSGGGRLVSFPGQGYGYAPQAPSYKFIPTLGYSHGPPATQSPSFEYAPSYYPTTTHASHQTSASYGQGLPPASAPYISGPKVTFKSEPRPQRPPGHVVPTRTKSVQFPDIRGRVPSLTKGSLSSLYSSAEDLIWDALNGVEGEDVALSALYDDGDLGNDYFGLGKPLKSYYSTPEEYYAILNDGGAGDQAHSPRPGSSSHSSLPVSVNYASGSPDYVSYGISSHPSSLKYPLKSYGSIKAPGSTSDDFLRDVQNSYGTPKDLRKPSTVGYYRTAGGSWARIPYVRGSSGYKYKYITTQQMPIMERDPLLLDLVEDEADFYDGLNEGRLRDPNCENKRHCDEGDLSTNEYRDIAENVQLTRRPKSSFTNAMFKKLMRNAVRQEGRRGQGQRRPRRGKGKRRRCGTRPKRCRKY
ncbi:uncharacterized protein LOC110862107 [Folsomia candida]|uniref:uncharacterized protein LOC110862107 n=1 Tax=Folsomia candida TaxID=158441 RepID=UPI000B9094FA|nr:uncharacterized protein LOC110862107 [Folsomia candida]